MTTSFAVEIKLDAPTFSPAAATNFETSQVVTIAAGENAPAGAKIHYTLNSDMPSETASGSTMLYDASGKITLTETTNAIKAIVIADGMTTSDAATSAVFTKLIIQVDPPLIILDIPSETATGSTMLYDASGKITLTETTNGIKAIVIADGFITSDVATSPTFTKLDTGWDGSLTELTLSGNTYQINEPGELAWIAAQTSESFDGKTINIGSDLDMNNQPFPGIAELKGTIDGNNHKILNLNINLPGDTNVGLVKKLLNGGSIKNLTIESGSIIGMSRAGAFAGRAQDNTILIGLINKASVATTGVGNSVGYAGGIVGYDIKEIIIQDSENYGTITGNYAGRIIGLSVNNATVQRVKNFGSIIGIAAAGGIIGKDANTTIVENSQNSGSVEGNYAGGIIGQASTGSTELKYFFNYGAVSADTKGSMIGKVSNRPTNAANSYYLDAGINVIGTGSSTPSNVYNLTANQFTNQSSFNGWNFSSIWEMKSGAQFPTLK